MKSTHVPEQQPVDPYASLIGARVLDRDGNSAVIRSVHRKGDATMAVFEREGGGTVETELADLERQGDSFFIARTLDRRNDEQTPAPEWHEEVKIPLAQEEVTVGQRRIDTGKGIRLKKHVLEHEEIVDVPRVEENLSIKHVEVGAIVSEDSLPQARQEGNTYIIPVFEEVYVVEKKIRLKEEVHITRTRKTSTQDQKISLRSEQVAIERFDEDASRD